MDALGLARLQFGITTVYHFFFVPLTLGLSILVALMETQYVRTGKEAYRQMTKFWGKLFVINFVLGVVTGIVMEFQFGMNWSEYARFVGDVFGAPLAIEALLAFFLESTFLGVWIFGWDKLSKRTHLAAIWLVAIAANLSALWILIANSWMQQPVGFAIENGRAVMTDFFAVIFNPNIWTQFPHVVSGGVVTAAFFVLGISAYHLIRGGEYHQMFQRSFQLAAVVGLVGTVLVIMTGHSQAQHMVEVQPMKMAAAEALWDTEQPAAMSIFTIGNEPERRDVFAIKVPSLLSLLACNQPNCAVQGINDLQAEYEALYGPGDYVPPVAVSYWSFRLMVGAGVVMLLAVLYAILISMDEGLGRRTRFLKYFPFLILLPYLANTSGWLLTELGRVPWVVFGLMRIEEAVSVSVTVGMVALTLVVFTLLYAVLIGVDIYLLAKYAREGSPTLIETETAPELTVSLVGD
ncbi:MAG: cytochrome ubiquinol oxidase subunit I [Candidatus Promineifilaceae bacterium]|nr:cytochrome ubiquinol oxidase subunit I [Candidatus Promineifilaceae bacterium]